MEKNPLPADSTNPLIETEQAVENLVRNPDTVVKPVVKYVDQHKMGVIAASVAAVALVGGLIFFLVNRNRTAVVTYPQPSSTLSAAATPSSQPVVISTANWVTYTDAVAGFSFKHPASALVNSQSNDATQLAITVAADKVLDLPEDLPLSMGRADALKEKARLATGQGQNVVKVGSLNGQTSTTYSQFEVCSVMFVRKITFYQGDYRVIINLVGPKDKIIAAMPAFFHVDTANCGSQLVWNPAKTTEFGTVLANNQGQGMAQEWYNTFDAMVGTIKLTTPVVTVTPSPSGLTYKNDTYGFELAYAAPYRLLTDSDSLSGYPNGVALLYTGGQAYDIVIEAWDTQADYEANYASRMSDIKVIQGKGKFITLLNNTGSPENQAIIDSVKVLP